MILGMLNPEKIWHENPTDLSISPVRCSHFTLGNPKKSFSTVLLIRSCDLHCQKKTVTNLPTPPQNITTITCDMQNFFIWQKACCVPSNISSSEKSGSEKSQLWVGIGGSKKNWLWCGNWNVWQATAQQVFKVITFCTDTCFQSFLPLIAS